MHTGVLAAITWDPFIRGVVILAIFIVLLPGSVYLVLSTDVGARLGFLLAAAGISGMIALLAILWVTLNSTADIGRANAWKPLAVVTGDFASQNTIRGVQDLPADLKTAAPPVPPLSNRHWFWPFQGCPDNTGWRRLTTAQQTDAESASDKVLVPAQGSTIPAGLTSPFTATSDYVYIGGVGKNANGGCLFSVEPPQGLPARGPGGPLRGGGGPPGAARRHPGRRGPAQAATGQHQADHLRRPRPATWDRSMSLSSSPPPVLWSSS